MCARSLSFTNGTGIAKSKFKRAMSMWGYTFETIPSL